MQPSFLSGSFSFSRSIVNQKSPIKNQLYRFGFSTIDSIRTAFLPLNDPALDSFYAKLTELDVPLFIHPAPAGIDGPSGDANLKQFDLDIINPPT